jgi:hypothetical protein
MERGYQAVSKLYHAWFTGMILVVVTRRGASVAEEFLFRIFRRQHLATFLPGLKKLDLDKLPAAVASAQYHYLSNMIGGVRVEYMFESDRKAWIRYAPPRWIWQGVAICGIPSEVSRGMLRGWHAHNGVTLGNPRLGFVCTKQTVDGQDSLEGYFFEYDRDLAPEERLRFAPGEQAPPFDPASAPRLATDSWPEERLAKAERNYCMEYVRTAVPVMIDLLGPEDARELGGRSAYLIGLQYFDECKTLLGIAGTGIDTFVEFFRRMAEAQGEEVTMQAAANGGYLIRQHGWRLMQGIEPLHPAVFEIWNALWEGCLAAHARHLSWRVHKQPTPEDQIVEWLAI